MATITVTAKDTASAMEDVFEQLGDDAYIIEKDLKEYLIPIVPDIIKKVDYDNRNIIIKVIDGLLN